MVPNMTSQVSVLSELLVSEEKQQAMRHVNKWHLQLVGERVIKNGAFMRN